MNAPIDMGEVPEKGGAAASQQPALVSDQAAARLAPPGFDQAQGTFLGNTKMYRRSDVVSVLMKEIAHQWELAESFEQSSRHIDVRKTRARLDTLRIIRDRVNHLPVFVLQEYAAGDSVPSGMENAERAQIAIDMAGPGAAAYTVALNALSGVRLPIDELRSRRFERLVDRHGDAPGGLA